MNQQLHDDAMHIVKRAIDSVRPEAAVTAALEQFNWRFSRLFLLAVGKAAWPMAKAAVDVAGDCIYDGMVITKYGHVFGPIPNVRCREAGHPVPDEAGIAATREALAMLQNLTAQDVVLFLLSGGGSALFEWPRVPLGELQSVNQALLASGADIVAMNTVRKRLSHVKGGQFAAYCAPARVYQVVLSDIVGDPLDMIASGPACADTSTCDQAVSIARQYSLPLSDTGWACLRHELPKALINVHTQITSNVKALCAGAAAACQELGYKPIMLNDHMTNEARVAGQFMGTTAANHASDGSKLAFIAGGETVVTLRGHGLGGRNQELALAAAKEIAGISNAAVFSVGSDGTDGPTDAAGGYVDGDTMTSLHLAGVDYDAALAGNDSYHALQAVGGLIITGPTGTNVNDVSVALVGDVCTGS